MEKTARIGLILKLWSDLAYVILYVMFLHSVSCCCRLLTCRYGYQRLGDVLDGCLVYSMLLCKLFQLTQHPCRLGGQGDKTQYLTRDMERSSPRFNHSSVLSWYFNSFINHKKTSLGYWIFIVESRTMIVIQQYLGSSLDQSW